MSPQGEPTRLLPDEGFEPLRRIFDASVDGMLAVDRDGIVLVANPAAERLLGRRPLVGTSFGFPVNLGVTVDIEVIRPEGPKTVAMRCSQVLLEGAEPARVVALHDVSDRVRAERSMRESMRVREELLAIASHEIRSPLTVISGMSATLRDHFDKLSDEDRQGLIERVAQRSAELAELAASMLDRVADGAALHADVEQIDLVPIVDRALEPFPDLDIEVDLPASLEVVADGTQVLEIVMNLVDNAQKYGAPPVEVRGTGEGSWVELRVVDHGDGVPEGLVGTLFDPFTRADAGGSGSAGVGLGMAIIRKLAAANYGNVWYERAPHGGACFVLRLPRVSS